MSRTCHLLLTDFSTRTQEQFFRRCKYIQTEKDGNKLENNTYTGALGMLQRNEADIKMRLGVELIGDDFFMSRVAAEGA